MRELRKEWERSEKDELDYSRCYHSNAFAAQDRCDTTVDAFKVRHWVE